MVTTRTTDLPSHTDQDRADRRRGPRWDATTVLTFYVVVLVAIPSALVLGALGGAGTPANLIALGLLLWWAMAKLGSGLGVDRHRQPIRIALLFFVIPIVLSLITFYSSPFTGLESTGVYRGLVYIAALVGVALLAADGIPTLERAHVLMRRIVHAVAAVAAVGVIEFMSGWRPASTLALPGLVRLVPVELQERSSFIRVQSTTLHPIELSALLGIVLPIAVHYALVSPPKRRKLAWVEVALIAGTIPLALSRTGVVAATISMGVFAAGWSWRQRGRAVMVVVAGLAALRVLVPGLVGSLFALFSLFSEDTSTTARQGRYEIAGRYFLQHPWTGRGFSTLYPATKQIFDNAYLYVATEEGALGVVGILLFFTMCIFVARGVKLRATDPVTAGVGRALSGSFAAMMVLFATADMMSFTMVIALTFLLVGAAGAFWRLVGGDSRSRAVSPSDLQGSTHSPA